MFTRRNVRRLGRPRPARKPYRPSIEAYERRELLTASPFLQGTVFVDPAGTGSLTTTSATLGGATVSLFAPGGATPLASVTTLADGNYFFGSSVPAGITGAVVPGGLTAGVQYTLVERPPTGYANTKPQVLSQVDPATALPPDTIQVTVVDPNKVVANLQGAVSPFNGVTYSVTSGSTTFNSPLTTINQLAFNLSGAPGVLASNFNTYCVDAADDLSNGASFATVIAPQNSLANGDRIAYLYNHYGAPGVAQASFPPTIQALNLKNLLAGVQVAIWDLEYNSGAATGAFALTSHNTTYTSDADFTQVQAAAAALVADSSGKSEKVSILDASLTGSVPSPAVPGSHGQSVLAAESFNFGNKPVGSLSGFVYVDNNNNGLKDSGEAGIGGVQVTASVVVNGVATPVGTVSTNPDGSYSFTNLNPGTYQTSIVQPASYLPGKESQGTTVLQVPLGTNLIPTIPVVGLLNNPNNNYGELLPATIAGMVYVDAAGNGLTGPSNSPPANSGDTPEAGVTVTLYADTNKDGILDAGDAVAGTAVTGTNGSYSFGNLSPATYFVQESTPSGYLQTWPVGGTYTVAANYFGAYPNNNFANFMSSCNAASLTNVKYQVNGSTVPDLRGYTSPGSTVTVTFTVPANVPSETLSLVAYSAPGSSFSASTASQQAIVADQTKTFGPGTYTLTVTVPNSYYQVDFVCGSPITQFGPAGSNIFYGAQGRLISADNGGSQAYAPDTISGVVYLDANGNGTFGAGDSGLAGVPITLTGTTATGVAVNVPGTTGANGTYSFTGVAPGTYTVTEAQPAGYANGAISVGTSGGVAGSNAISRIVLNSNTTATGYNFGEVGTSISGTVYTDVTGNGFSLDDKPLANVTVNLLGAGNTLVATTMSASNGTYSFKNVPAGPYTVQEVTPAGDVQTGPISGTYAVNTATSPTSTGNDFDNFATCSMSNITNVVYSTSSWGSGPSLSGNTKQGDTVYVNFTVTGTASQVVTLVAYTIPNINNPSLTQQYEYSVSTGSYAPGSYKVSVKLPNNYYQVDFVCGPAIDHFGPNGSNIFYHAEGRFIGSDAGGQNPPPAVMTSLADNDANIGNQSKAGTFADNNGYYTVTGSGADIWNNADAFHYVYQTLNGDGEVVARVDSISNTDSWAKAGIMIRQSLDPGSAHASVFVTPGNGVAFQDRTSSGAGSNNWAGDCVSGPEWIKLVRLGSTLAGFDSTDGIHWNYIGSDTVCMSQQVYVGLAVTSHNNGAVATATFDSVSTQGFWASQSGQSLIQSFNGSATSTALSTWLATSYPNLYGTSAGSNCLLGLTNNGVAQYALSLSQRLGAESLEAQTLATALSIYATTSKLGGSAGQSCGFTVDGYGLGCQTYNIGDCGSAFGTWNNQTLSVSQMMKAVNNQAVGGVLYKNNASCRSQAQGMLGWVQLCSY